MPCNGFESPFIQVSLVQSAVYRSGTVPGNRQQHLAAGSAASELAARSPSGRPAASLALGAVLVMALRKKGFRFRGSAACPLPAGHPDRTALSHGATGGQSGIHQRTHSRPVDQQHGEQQSQKSRRVASGRCAQTATGNSIGQYKDRCCGTQGVSQCTGQFPSQHRAITTAAQA